MRCRSMRVHALSVVAGCIWGAVWALDVRAESEEEESDIDFELSGKIGIENRWYPEPSAHEGQSNYASGVVLEPELYFMGEDWEFSFVPFLRYDSGDAERTHWDIREAYFLFYGELGEGGWEARLGVDRVFWGVVEGNHLVDIINQVDAVEQPDLEDELGQLMAHVTLNGDWGAAEFFLMPHHRERTFSGYEGRMRSGILVDGDHPTYESSAKQWHTDFAFRYSHSMGPFDIGLSAFDGTSREATLRPAIRQNGLVLVPHYEQIRQYSIDAQMTTEAWLFKLEAIHRAGLQNARMEEQDYAALALGVEYTFYSVFDSSADFSLLVEWYYDERGEKATTANDDDLLFATRYALNDAGDTEFYASLLKDRQHSTMFFVTEANWRLTDQWSVVAESFIMLHADERDTLINEIRRDSYFEFRLNYSF